MRTKLWAFLAFTLIFNLTKAQIFEHPEFIKKKKKTALSASRIIHYEDSTVTQEKYSYWEFDQEGREVLEIDFDKNGNEVTRIVNTYENDRLTQTKIERKNLDELEVTNYEYDDKGNLIKKAEFRDEKPIISYKYFYSGENQLDSILWYNGKGEIQLYEYHVYKDGQLVEIWEKTGYGRKDGRTEIFYHTDGTLKEEKLYDSFGDLFEQLVYNEQGWLVTKKIFYDEGRVLIYNYEYKSNGLMKSSTKYDSSSEVWEEYEYKWGKK